ncbi:TniQ family protein [Paraburkholderia sp. BR10954]|uniref:TniQ family protein n=1 Tax=Paraburkholderia sp. BR10954 TaxID=3236995 RepID=UPI0034D1EEF1
MSCIDDRLVLPVTTDVDAAAAEHLATCCIPAVLPGETVYSWCARFHRLNCGGDVGATSLLLFGHPTAGLTSGFPSRLVHFHSITGGAFGTLSDVLRRGTLFGFHAPFLPNYVREGVRRYLLYGGPSGELDRTLGIWKAGLNIIRPLRFCSACVVEQLSQRGHGWWMESHQQPSSFSCLIHHQWLRVADPSLRPVLLGEYCLPDVLDSQTVANGLDESLSCCRQLTRLVEWANFIRRLDGLWLDGESLRHIYRLQTKARGWVTFKGDVQLEQFRDAFTAYYGSILQLFPERIGEVGGGRGGSIARLLMRWPAPHYPVKHLLLLSFLFEAPGDFVALCARVQVMRSGGSRDAIESPLCSGRQC